MPCRQSFLATLRDYYGGCLINCFACLNYLYITRVQTHSDPSEIPVALSSGTPVSTIPCVVTTGVNNIVTLAGKFGKEAVIQLERIDDSDLIKMKLVRFGATVEFILGETGTSDVRAASNASECDHSSKCVITVLQYCCFPCVYCGRYAWAVVFVTRHTRKSTQF